MNTLSETPLIKYRTRPWDHQIVGTKMIMANESTVLMWDMGTGKTKSVIDAMCNLECTPVLIVCPKSVIDVWITQIDKHKCNDMQVVALSATTNKEKADQLITQMNMARSVDKQFVAIVNYESVWRPFLAKAILDRTWGMVVLDECHKIKSYRSKASQFMLRVRRNIHKRVGLSGTLMPHGPVDIFAQYRFFDPELFGWSLTRFRSRYCIMGGYQGKEILGYRNMDELHDKIFSIAHRVKKEDVLDLPEATHQFRSVELSDNGQKAYDQMQNRLIVEIKSGEVKASNGLVKLLRLQQITSGFLSHEDVCETIDTSKYDELLNIFEDIGKRESIVVFAQFRADLIAIKQATEKSLRQYFELSGSVNELGSWKDADVGAILGTQIQAGSLGVDMTRARYAVYYSTGLNRGNYEQSLARLHRPGQKHNVTYLHIAAKGTVDYAIYGAFKAGARIVETVLEGLASTAIRKHKKLR